jgi:hypothetical protein
VAYVDLLGPTPALFFENMIDLSPLPPDDFEDRSSFTILPASWYGGVFLLMLSSVDEDEIFSREYHSKGDDGLDRCGMWIQ